ncbi:MAG: hypothetical protein WCX73_04360 [Candidatus Pacearchaeota archaeon]|jgi:hypothetical protein
MNAEEYIKENGCEHDGSFVPITEVKRLMKAYASLKVAEAMPTNEETQSVINEADRLFKQVVKYYSCSDEDLIRLQWNAIVKALGRVNIAKMPSEEEISIFLDDCNLETSEQRENMYDAIEWFRNRIEGGE